MQLKGESNLTAFEDKATLIALAGHTSSVRRRSTMSDLMSHYLVPAAVIAVAVVLLLGLINMMRGGSPNRSQKLMRLRVLLQFVAIIVIMATIWAMGH
jgi:Hypoxia induced protein conserved region